MGELQVINVLFGFFGKDLKRFLNFSGREVFASSLRIFWTFVDFLSDGSK